MSHTNQNSPCQGFWVPLTNVIGKGSKLYAAFALDPDGGGEERQFIVAARF